MTVTVEIINDKALNLLSDMEQLDLIKVIIPQQTVPSLHLNTYANLDLARSLKLSDKQYENYQKTLQEGRDEWDRNIF